MSVYRAGLVGCGRIGSEFDEDPKRKTVASHAGAYSSNPKTRLVAVSDSDKAKLDKCRARWNVPAAYPDYREMLRSEDLDILSICTWSTTHLPILQDAAQSKVKAIFCEKPLATKISDAEKMVDICRKKGILLMVDHQRRFDTLHREIRGAISAGRLGRVQQATFYYTAGIANTGTHMLDLLRFFFGDAAWVQGAYSENKSPNEQDPNIDGMVKFKNGVLCGIQACDVRSYLAFDLSIFGTEGRIDVCHSGFDARYYSVSDSDYFSGYKELREAPHHFQKSAEKEGFMKQAVAHLVECLEQKKEPLCKGEDGLAALELICALHESARNSGMRVELPLKNREMEILSK